MWYRYAFNKLVRSFILDKEEKQNKMINSYKILNEEEYKKELINKFHEEALEVVDARDKNELIEEIGDCYEVIDEILKTHGISKEEVLIAQKKKRDRKGGFDKRIFVNNVQYDDKNPSHQLALNYIKDKRQEEKYKLIGKYDKHIVDFIITNETKDKIYIQKRSAIRKTYPNCWELPGGTLEVNEILEDCIRRELKEELNLDLLRINEIIYETDCIIGSEKCAYTVFAIEVSNWENFKLEEGKADELRWISKDEIEVLNINREDGDVSPVYKSVIKFFGLTIIKNSFYYRFFI
jgi:8-oxo-dGTP pyrophosphatase MutT (NUDIX family)/predicted house-cleaning noncanonical NTP pyrophosphatase (MazG superfamily)